MSRTSSSSVIKRADCLVITALYVRRQLKVRITVLLELLLERLQLIREVLDRHTAPFDAGNRRAITANLAAATNDVRLPIIRPFVLYRQSVRVPAR